MIEAYRGALGCLARATEVPLAVIYDACDGDNPVPQCAVGPDHQPLSAALFAGNGLPATVCRTSEVQTLFGPFEAAELRIHFGLGEVGLHSVVGWPIVYMGRCLGALVTAHTTAPTAPRRAFVAASLAQLAIRMNGFQVEQQRLQLVADLQARSNDLQAQTTALEEARLEAERASRAKSEFLANMSHELRTPMNSIMGFTQRLITKLGDTLPERELKALLTVDRNAKHLLSLINDILDLSKIEAGKMELNRSRLDLAAVVREAAEQAAPLTDNKPVEVRLDLPDAPLMLDGDRVRLKQVVLNLLSNAIRYTNAGTVTITAGEGDDTALGRVVRLAVRDTGIGIKPEDLGRLFKQFTQLDGSTARKVGGTGLGLAISAHYVRMHGGRIDVASEFGTGTEFTVLLPLQLNEPPAGRESIESAGPRPRRLVCLSNRPTLATSRPSPHGTAAAARFGGVRILCVDDEPDVLTFLQLTFEDAGYDVMLACDHDAAIAEAKARRPDLICLDLNMPGKDGFEVLKTLRADPDLSHIPVIVVSVSSEESRCLASGALRYLAKPVRAVDLMETVREVLAGAVGSVLIVEDNPDTVRLYAELLTEQGLEVRTAVNGREGLDRLADSLPSVIVLDLMMPIMDGFTFLDIVQRDPVWCRLPVIILTAMPLTPEEVARLERSSAAILIKGRDATEQVVNSILKTALPRRRAAGRCDHVNNTILVVEDNSDNMKLFAWTLEDEGYVLEGVGSAEEGLAALARRPFDLVLMDIALPGIDGMEATRRIRAQSRFACLPIIAVTAHAIKAEAQAILAAGVTAVVTKPIDEARSIRPSGLASGETRNMAKVLVVDDVADNVKLLACELEDHGYEVFTAADGPRALEAAEAARPDVILLDIMMPGMDGIEVCRRLKADASLCSIPVIFVSALEKEGDLIRGLDAGGQDYIIKPFNTRIVMARVRSATRAKAAYDLIVEMNGKLEHGLERIAALRRIDQAINSSFELRPTLDLVLDQIAIALGADAADVLLCDHQTNALKYATGRGFRTNAREQAYLQLDRSVAGQVVLERRPTHLADLSRSIKTFAEADSMALEGFRAYSGLPLVAKGLIVGVLEVFYRTARAFDPEALSFLAALAEQSAIIINNASLFEGSKRASNELTLAYAATIEGWSRALDLRDKETEGHSLRVTEMTLRLAQALEIGEAELVHIRRGALLHDIGKMAIPDSILLKPGPLTADEWVIMRRHPAYAHDWLAPIPFLRPALEIPHCHHEKWDGSGYPRGLAGERIPLAARIFAAVDIWDALRSDRPYRKGWTDERIRTHIAALAGTHLDPGVVAAFLPMIADDVTPLAAGPCAHHAATQGIDDGVTMQALHQAAFSALLSRSGDFVVLLDGSGRIQAADHGFVAAFTPGCDPRGLDFIGLLDSGSREKAQVFLDEPFDGARIVELNHLAPALVPRLISYSVCEISAPAGMRLLAAVGRESGRRSLEARRLEGHRTQSGIGGGAAHPQPVGVERPADWVGKPALAVRTAGCPLGRGGAAWLARLDHDGRPRSLQGRQ